MRIMGLDFGSKTVGVAVSDPLGITAQGLEIIRRKEENKLRQTYARIEELIVEYQVEEIVLGMPKNMNGTEGVRVELTQEFREKLMRRTGLPVVLWDERLTTVAAQNALKEAGISCQLVNRVSQAHPNILDLIASGTIELIINTPTKGRKQDSDGFRIRRSAVEHGVGCVTAIDTARALLTIRQQSRSEDLTPIDITTI